MQHESTPLHSKRLRPGNVLDEHMLLDGTTFVLRVSGSSTGSRKWGIWRTLRVVRLIPGAVYHSSRSKGVQVLWSREFDQRSNPGTSAAISAGQQVYLETVARARLQDARQIAAEIVATL